MANIVVFEMIRSTGITSSLGTAFSTQPTSTFEAPLLDDVTIETNTQYSTLAELVPSTLMNIFTLMRNLGTLGGRGGAGIVNLQNRLDLPRWQKTDPPKVQMKLGFFTKENPEEDVLNPVIDLVGSSILTYERSTNSYILPGVSLATSVSGPTSGIGGRAANAKLISMEIPGLIYIPLGLVERAIPTWSKEITESAIPLWCQLDLTIMGLMPATTEIYTGARDITRGIGFLKGLLQAEKQASRFL